MRYIDLPSARHLLMNLLLAAEDVGLRAADMIASSELFGISSNATRVALARLAASGLIEATGRGSYRVGPAGVAVGNEVAHWRSAEERLKPWNGSWIIVQSPAAERGERHLQRRKERAFALLGLREFEPGFLVRPDNLKGGAHGVRERLAALEVPGDIAVCRIVDVDEVREARGRALWDAEELTRRYRKRCEEIAEWLEQAGDLPLGIAARQAFLLGDASIREIVFDPLLPEEFLDPKQRWAWRDAVLRLDEVGREIWTRFLTEMRINNHKVELADRG